MDLNLCLTSPYPSSEIALSSESEAYRYFQSNGGIEAYAHKLYDVIQAHPNVKYMVGFSAGAAALYKVMSQVEKSDVQLMLFYPGQIRFYLDHAPNCPCTIIFPQNESHFGVTEVIDKLRKYKHLNIQHTAYQHGFMNRASAGFDINAYRYYGQLLKDLLGQEC